MIQQVQPSPAFVRVVDEGVEVYLGSAERSVADARVFAHDVGVDVAFRVDAGQLPRGIRRGLVDAVFALPAIRRARRVHASIPRGDTDLLAGLRSYCGDVTTRVAGSTCLVEGYLGHPGHGSGHDHQEKVA